MTEMLLYVGPLIVFLATQVGKYASKDVNPLWIAFCASVVGGIGYATLLYSGHWEAVRDFALVAFTGAVTIHNVLKQAIGAMKR